MTKESTTVVVGIWIGAEYSGFAVSFKNDYQRDPMNVRCKIWQDEYDMKQRIPTTLLLKPDTSFQSFGYEAEKDYHKISLDPEGTVADHYYFNHFNNVHALREDVLIKTMGGKKSLSAMHLFSLVIKYLKDEFCAIELSRSLEWIPSVKYVLVVPAIWDESSKELITEAAQKAGIEYSDLEIVTEPIAAVTHFRHSLLSEHRLPWEHTKTMTVALEGGIAEVTVLKRLSNGTDKEIRPPKKKAFGTKSMYDVVGNFLKEMFGSTIVQKYQTTYPREYRYLLRSFINKLCTDSESSNVNVQFPCEFGQLIAANYEDEIHKIINLSKYSDSIKYIGGKIRIPREIFDGLFKPFIDGIVNLIQEFLGDKKCQDMNTIILYGEYAECQLFREAIEKAVPGRQISVCRNPSCAVLSGAALFGHSCPPTEKPKATKARLLVAALDFGTTYSGYAFSSKHDFKSDPLKININSWNAETKALISHKTPTAILLKPDETLHSFGYQAENNFLQIAEGGDEKDYYFFHRFKMMLHGKTTLERDTPLVDETGKSLPARIIFAHAIRYLKNHLLETLKNSFTDLQEKDIQYVLTVPAIWDDAAKQFMRHSAEEAGIQTDQLTLALEPEAASIYCQYVPVKKSSSEMSPLAIPGTKYMVVDLGGGTTDVTVHLKEEDGSLQELHSAIGGSWGGINVDAASINLLEDIVGPYNVTKLKEDSMEDYIDLVRGFEIKKRSIKADDDGKISIIMPFALIDILKKDKSKKDFKQAIRQSIHADTVSYAKQKLIVDSDAFRKIFEPTIAGIIATMKEILHNPNFTDVDYILMVGGFSNCHLVHSAVRETFKGKRTIIPDDADLAVLKGAVLFGHNPKTITRRIARKTYGIKICPYFDQGKHPVSKKILINGEVRCKDVFLKYISKGEWVVPGHQISTISEVLRSDEYKFDCEVYWSNESDPQFVDEISCHRLGILTVPLDQTGTEQVEIEQTIIFGETELIIQAKDLSTNKLYQTYFEFFEGSNPSQ